MLLLFHPTNLGYLEIDQRALGLPHVELSTYTCTHCERVVVMNPERKRERMKCRGCNHLICDECAVRRTAGEPCKTYRQHLDELCEEEAKAERQAEASPIILP